MRKNQTGETAMDCMGGILILLVFMFFVIFIPWVIIRGHLPVDGIKSGQIIKLSKEGRFYSTYEGQLIKGGMNNGSGSFGGIFEFTVSDLSLLPKINEAIEEQKEVVIHYASSRFCPLSSETSDCIFVDSVKIKN